MSKKKSKIKSSLNLPTILTLISIVGILLFLYSTKPSSASTTWTENWDSYDSVLTRWNGNGDAGPGFNPRCFTVPQSGLLDMKCQSAGLHSKNKYDPRYPITIQGKVIAEPNSSHNRFWGGIGPLVESPTGNDDDLCKYANLNTTGGLNYDGVVSLFDCYSNRISYIAQPRRWFDFKVEWKPPTTRSPGYYYFYVDGSLRYQTQGTLSGDVVAKVYCVSVHPGTPNDGSSSHCQFQPVTITGISVGTSPSPSANPSPSITPTPSPSPSPSPPPNPSPSPTPLRCRLWPWLCK